MTIESKYENELKDIPTHLKGETRIREVKTRVNQNVFRKIVLANILSQYKVKAWNCHKNIFHSPNS